MDILQPDPFLKEGDILAAHPFLAKAESGSLQPREWAMYVAQRLGAGTHFVAYLESLAEAAKQDGLSEIQHAVEENLGEEVGIWKGIHRQESEHIVWRTWFREGMERVLSERGIDPIHLQPKNIAGSDAYEKNLNQLKERGDAFEMTGAFAGLEILIAKEYEKIKTGLESQFGGDLNGQELTYIRSHAFHDLRHFDEIFKPLQRACDTREKMQRVLSGLRAAAGSKTAFLNGLWEEIEKSPTE